MLMRGLRRDVYHSGAGLRIFCMLKFSICSF